MGDAPTYPHTLAPLTVPNAGNLRLHAPPLQVKPLFALIACTCSPIAQSLVPESISRLRSVSNSCPSPKHHHCRVSVLSLRRVRCFQSIHPSVSNRSVLHLHSSHHQHYPFLVLFILFLVPARLLVFCRRRALLVSGHQRSVGRALACRSAARSRPVIRPLASLRSQTAHGVAPHFGASRRAEAGGVGRRVAQDVAEPYFARARASGAAGAEPAQPCSAATSRSRSRSRRRSRRRRCRCRCAGPRAAVTGYHRHRPCGGA